MGGRPEMGLSGSTWKRNKGTTGWLCGWFVGIARKGAEMRIRALGLLAVVALVVASCGGAVPEAAGPSEGIQVHGDWTIDVYNPDGTLDESVEFENALLPVGAEWLVNLALGDPWTKHSFRIEFGSSSGGPCGTGEDCTIVSSLCVTACLDPTDPTVFESLQVTSENLDEIPAFDDTVRLSGSATATNAATIDNVATKASNRFFTSAFLDPADQADVEPGQTVQIQVDISFTSG